MRRLSTQTQSFQNINGNVCFRRKPPCSFRDRNGTTLLASTLWQGELTGLTIERIASSPGQALWPLQSWTVLRRRLAPR